MAYSDKVIDHYENPRNVGTLDKDDPSVGTGLVGAPACGDVMRLQIKVSRRRRHRGRQVQDLRLRLGHRVVVARDRVAQGQDGRRGRDASRTRTIVEELNLPPVKIHCSVLAEDAIKSAIADFRKKQAERRAARRRASERLMMSAARATAGTNSRIDDSPRHRRAADARERRGERRLESPP